MSKINYFIFYQNIFNTHTGKDDYQQVGTRILVALAVAVERGVVRAFVALGIAVTDLAGSDERFARSTSYLSSQTVSHTAF
jgi:hypothetical protein